MNSEQKIPYILADEASLIRSETIVDYSSIIELLPSNVMSISRKRMKDLE